MENIDQNYEEQINQLQWYIDHFKNRMKSEMKQSDFEPNATQEYDGYDGVNTELSKNLDTMGINKIKIFTSPEQSKSLFDQCTYTKNIISFHTDQLASALICSTRKPYHDINTGKLYDDQTKNLQIEDILDSRLVAELLLKEKEKLEKIKKIEDFLWRWRNAHITAIHNQTLDNIHVSFRTEIEQLWIKEAYSLGEFADIIDHCLYQWRKVYLTIRKQSDSVSQEDYQLFQALQKDPIFHKLMGSTWADPDNTDHIFDDKKLAQVLYRLSQK